MLLFRLFGITFILSKLLRLDGHQQRDFCSLKKKKQSGGWNTSFSEGSSSFIGIVVFISVQSPILLPPHSLIIGEPIDLKSETQSCAFSRLPFRKPTLIPSPPIESSRLLWRRKRRFVFSAPVRVDAKCGRVLQEARPQVTRSYTFPVSSVRY